MPTLNFSDRSLRKYLKRQAIRWSFYGFALTLLIGAPCILYSAKIASERQIVATAKSVSRVFRPMILEDNIRDVEIQIREALDLSSEENAVYYDTEFKAVYLLNGSNETPVCKTPKEVCWGNRFKTLSVLFPVYFNDHKEEGIAGYLELTLKPNFDLTLIYWLGLFLILAFTVQAFGLSSVLTRSVHLIVSQLSRWADHLKNHPETLPEETGMPIVPFTELKSMQDAVEGLYLEIARLQEKSAKEAKTEAQFAMLKEISHDLKSPHSSMARYFALHLDTIRSTGKINEDEVDGVIRHLKTMGELLRQIKIFPTDSTLDSSCLAASSCDITVETAQLMNELKQNRDFSEKKIRFDLTLENSPPAWISPLGYARVLENLVRNAAEAIPKEGQIQIFVSILEGRPALLVRDNGCGIPIHIQSKIFDFDFTTKPFRGTGLGLGIVKKLCELYGAEIRLNSSEGMGTEFTVLFRSFYAADHEKHREEVSHAQL